MHFQSVDLVVKFIKCFFFFSFCLSLFYSSSGWNCILDFFLCLNDLIFFFFLNILKYVLCENHIFLVIYESVCPYSSLYSFNNLDSLFFCGFLFIATKIGFWKSKRHGKVVILRSIERIWMSSNTVSGVHGKEV